MRYCADTSHTWLQFQKLRSHFAANTNQRYDCPLFDHPLSVKTCSKGSLSIYSKKIGFGCRHYFIYGSQKRPSWNNKSHVVEVFDSRHAHSIIQDVELCVTIPKKKAAHDLMKLPKLSLAICKYAFDHSGSSSDQDQKNFHHNQDRHESPSVLYDGTMNNMVFQYLEIY